MRLIIDWNNKMWENIFGLTFSYRGLKSLIPGAWGNDEKYI